MISPVVQTIWYVFCFVSVTLESSIWCCAFIYKKLQQTKAAFTEMFWRVDWIYLSTQEGIPVGCVPLLQWSSLRWGGGGGAVCPGDDQGGGHPQTHRHVPSPQTQTPPFAILHVGIQPPMPIACWITPPPMNRMTDRCKNITLPQTSFEGGNYKCFFIAFHLTIWSHKRSGFRGGS